MIMAWSVAGSQTGAASAAAVRRLAKLPVNWGA